MHKEGLTDVDVIIALLDLVHFVKNEGGLPIIGYLPSTLTCLLLGKIAVKHLTTELLCMSVTEVFFCACWNRVVTDIRINVLHGTDVDLMPSGELPRLWLPEEVDMLVSTSALRFPLAAASWKVASLPRPR